MPHIDNLTFSQTYNDFPTGAHPGRDEMQLQHNETKDHINNNMVPKINAHEDFVAGWTSGSNTNGNWRKDPSGIIEQWGVAAVTAGSPTTITLPIPFITGVQSVTVTPDNWANTFTVTSKALANFGCQVSGAGTVYINWRAIGK